MAATFRTSFAGGGTSGSSNRTITVTPAVGDFWIVFVNLSGNSGAGPSCSDDNSGTYTKIGNNIPLNASVDRCAVFVRDQRLTNTTSTVITITSGSNTAGEIVVIAYSGGFASATGIRCIRQFAAQSNQAAGGTPAPVFPIAVLTGNPTIGFIGNGSNPAGMTQPTGWTERQDVGQNNPPTGVEAVTRDSGFTGTTVTWGSTSATAFASFVVEIDLDWISDDTATPVLPPHRALAELPIYLPEESEDYPSTPAALPPDEDFWDPTQQLLTAPGPPKKTSAPNAPLYFYDKNEWPTPPAAVVTDEDTWTQQRVASSQIAEAVAPGAFPESDGDVSLFGPEEFYWQNPVAPKPLVLYQQLPLTDTDDPAGSLSVVPDDSEMWINWVPPRPLRPYQPLPLIEADGDVTPLTGTPDDNELWQNWVPPAPVRMYQPLPVGERDGEVSLFSPEEDFWQNPVAPKPLVLYQPLPLIDTDDPAGSLTGTPDDSEIWQNWVPPSPLRMYQPLPLIEADGDIAPLTGTVDDNEVWQNPVAPKPLILYQQLPLTDTDETVTPTNIAPDDSELWQNWVPPTPPRMYQPLPLIETDGDVTPLTGTPDDNEIWRNPVPARALIMYQPLPLIEQDGEVSLFSPEEEYWQNPVAPRPLAIFQWLPITERDGDVALFSPEEDYWQNPVAPKPLILYQPLPLTDTDDPAGSLSVVPDDSEMWLNWVPPKPLAMYQVLPFTEADGDVAPLTGTPDDNELWQNQVRPRPLVMYQALPIIEQDGEVSLFSPEEDYWQSLYAVPPVQAPLLITDTDEIVTTTTTPDDSDVWQPLVPARERAYPPPFIEADDASPLTGTPDDNEIWQNPVAPKPPTLYQPLPLVIEEDTITPTFVESDEPAVTPVMALPPYRQHPVVDDQLEIVSIQFDEEQPPMLLVWRDRPAQPLALEEDIVPIPALTPDEDFWLPHEHAGIASWYVLLSIPLYELPQDEVPQPPTPPTPRPRRGHGGYGPAGGGGLRLFEEEFTYGEDEDDPRPHSRTVEALGDEPASALSTSASSLAQWTGAGYATYAGTKAITKLAEKHFGRGGATVAAISSALATSMATKKWAENSETGDKYEGPLLLGSMIAAVDDLLDLYVNDRGKKPTPARVATAQEFLKHAQANSSLVVTQRTGTRKSTGERVVVLRYASLAKSPPTLYVYTEILPLSRTGKFPIRGTLLEAIRRVTGSK